MATNSIWQFATAGSLKFGRGSRHDVPALLKQMLLVRPLIVTDRTLLGLPLVEKFCEDLGHVCDASLVFADCVAEPAVEVAEAAVAVDQERACDCVIGIGGGSNLDVAKVAAVVLKHAGRPQDYFGFDNVPGPVLPVFALPTTAGTGSEVSHSAVLTDTAQQTKVSTLSRWLRPAFAIVDPELTDSCPPTVTAHSGIDALVHALEALTNKDYEQMVGVDPQARAYEGSYGLTRLLAGEAIRLVAGNLVATVQQAKQGDDSGVVTGSARDKSPRDAMALAATLAGMAFSNSGVGIVHALEYPIGALTHCGHGEGNGLLLPHVMRFNLEHCLDEFGQIAQWFGKDTSGMSAKQAAECGVDAVCELQQAIGIRTQLRDLGLDRSSIPEVASKAVSIRRLMELNRRRPVEADLRQILEQAY